MKRFEKYKYRMNYFVSEKDNGIRDAFNKGIAKASGEWCNFMNAGDSFYGSDVLEKVAAELERHHDCDVLFGNVCFTLNSRSKSHVRYFREISRFFFFIGDFVHQGAFIKRRLFELYGGYDDNFKMIADWVHAYKLYLNNCTFYYFDKTLANYDTAGESSTNKKECYNLIKIFHDQYYSPEETKEFTALEKKIKMEIVRNKLYEKGRGNVDEEFFDNRKTGLIAIFSPVRQ
jgi:glycosyltransferase involved in cell wall biosynthesis